MSYNFRDQVNKRFQDTLEHYLGRIDYSKPKNPKILNIGCGWCPEAEMLIDYFEGSMKGIDINEAVITSLKKKYKKEKRYEFICGDARKLRNLIGEKEMDIVIARHPDVRNDNWGKMFKEGYRVTKKGGIVIATCYFPGEPDVAKDDLTNAKYKVNICEENIFPLVAGPFPSFSDKYIIIGQKQ